MATDRTRDTAAAPGGSQAGHQAADAVVERRLRALAGRDPAKKFGQAVRQAIDEVLDGPRTGRCKLAELAKTEKTYVGTKVEIVVRTCADRCDGGTHDPDSGHQVVHPAAPDPDPT